MLLTSQNVNETFVKCLFTEDEVKDLNPGETPQDAILIEGLCQKIGFNGKRIEENKKNISAMLMQLPKQFREKEGGGWSFLNACKTKDGEEWTGMHQHMEELLLLGIAAGYAKIMSPRETWKIFPGGVPYFMIKEH